jgi:hypothetical protein
MDETPENDPFEPFFEHLRQSEARRRQKSRQRVRVRTPPAVPPDAYLVDALKGPAPCDGCAGAARCGAERLACSAFALYSRNVSTARWSAAPRLDATRERFDGLFAMVPRGGRAPRVPVGPTTVRGLRGR